MSRASTQPTPSRSAGRSPSRVDLRPIGSSRQPSRSPRWDVGRRLGLRQLGFEFLDGHRLAIQKPLEKPATMLFQEVVLLFCLDALRDDFDVKHLRQGDDGLNDALIAGLLADVANKGPIDLQLMQRQFRQACERGVAGSEVIYRKLYAEETERVHLGDGIVDIQHDALRDFQRQARWVDRRDGQRLLRPLHEARIVELSSADIDCKPKEARNGAAFPYLELGTGCLQHPTPDRHDQPRFLRQRNKASGEHDATLRMLPTKQHLRADRLKALADLRLKVKRELILNDGRPQFVLNDNMLVQDGLHVLLEEPQGVAPRLLGLVHGKIGMLDQVRRGSGVQIEIDPNAGRQVKGRRVEPIGFGERRQYLFADQLRLVHGRSPLAVQPLQNDRKLVASEARDGVAFAYNPAEPICHLNEHQVANIVPAGIVDRLEIVEVDQQHRSIDTTTSGVCQGMAQPVL